ncbi:MAG: hypothetical protein U9R11_01995 [Chloroflexota bacterium]|nr:hypothetical protein [Chloroflexota bacterium]
MEKLSTAREESDFPYDVALHLTADEVHEVDSALYLMMADATIAKKFGGPANEWIGKTRISELAKFVPTVGDILRRLHLSERLAVLEWQVADLQKRVEQFETKGSS